EKRRKNSIKALRIFSRFCQPLARSERVAKLFSSIAVRPVSPFPVVQQGVRPQYGARLAAPVFARGCHQEYLRENPLPRASRGRTRCRQWNIDLPPKTCESII